MKTILTKELLKKDLAKQNRTLTVLLAFAGIFCLLCLLLVPNKLVALGITAFVALFAGGMYLKYRRMAGKRDLSRACLRLLPLMGKNAIEHTDQDEDGTTTTVEFCLDFGENRAVLTDKKAFDEALAGELYYVAFWAEDDAPFACYSAADYEPGPEIPVVE
jgi:hypothetical protein